MKEHEKKNALKKNALLFFLSLVFILISGMKVARAQQVIYVDQKQRFWPDAVKTISEGIAKAKTANCKEIWVAEGTYQERIQLFAGLCLYGGFAGDEVFVGDKQKKEIIENRNFRVNRTVIDAELKGVAVVGAPGAVIDGLVIKNGKAAQGGGIFCSQDNPYSPATITIENCTITRNEASSGNGGGIYLNNYSPTIRNCEIFENTALNGAGGGIYLLSTTAGLIKNNEIQRNRASKGAGLYLRAVGAEVEIRNNLISRNVAMSGEGGGVYMEKCSSPLFSNNVVAQNQARDGAGGIYLYLSHPILINDTIAENIATMNAYSELSCILAQPTITNCIIWSMGGGYAVYSQYPMTKVSYSDISDLGVLDIAGVNTNISQDPKFKDTLYHLQTGPDGSVCIDAGDPTSPLDPDGTPCDMGAYGGAGAGKVGCDYVFPTIEVMVDPIPPVEASGSGVTMAWFKISPRLVDNALEIYLNDTLIVVLSDNDAIPPKFVLTDSQGLPIDPAAIALVNGANLLTITAIDSYGHQSARGIQINVVDTTAPVITCPEDTTLEAEGADGVLATSSAAQAFLGAAVASDVVDGAVAVVSDAPAVFGLGETVVTFTATDKAGNVGSCQAKVSVVDTTAPVITNCPGNITVRAEGAAGTSAASEAIQAFLNEFAATDKVGVSVSNDAPAIFPIGDTVVTFTAQDTAGNKTTCTATVTVMRSGDVDGDGKLTIKDAEYSFRCYLGQGPCSQACDVDGDGKVTINDARCIFQKYLGQPSCLD
ncbi:MAG: right-handed parallel beta-helix repeat-containing protein [bacterium]|nr:right-handed parallel beta-helix repeat-containing protein [bacterium]